MCYGAAGCGARTTVTGLAGFVDEGRQRVAFAEV